MGRLLASQGWSVQTSLQCPAQATPQPPTGPLRDLSSLIAAGRPNLRVGRDGGGPWRWRLAKAS